MPTYDFRCSEGHRFERFFGRISDAPSEVACPECGEVATRQISGGAGLIFKGSGFYITDYGKDGKKDQRAAAAAHSASSKTGDGQSHNGKSDGGDGKGSPGAGGDGGTASGATKAAESTGGSDKGSDSSKAPTTPAAPRPTAGE